MDIYAFARSEARRIASTVGDDPVSAHPIFLEQALNGFGQHVRTTTALETAQRILDALGTEEEEEDAPMASSTTAAQYRVQLKRKLRVKGILIPKAVAQNTDLLEQLVLLLGGDQQK